MRQSYWEGEYKLTSLTAEIPNYSLRPAATTATAQPPIPRQGDSCPTGTYKSGNTANHSNHPRTQSSSKKAAASALLGSTNLVDRTASE
jgi:hypothetical protein